jgi:hypothetical protein
VISEHRLTGLKKTHRDVFFDSEGPAGTFARKIALAAALGIVGPITHRNLTFIKTIRNAFAHAKIPIDFETREVSDVCEEGAPPSPRGAITGF